MPDPTILSMETGTRHRTAERVSKQTKALVIAISQRRDVVSLYVEGIKYILEDIPTVLSKANQGLATLEKYRARLDQVAGRLTALEFAGGVVLYDVLSVLQRAELVTRMATEVERYIIELGTEGRLIEMQLEETVVGVMAERAALVRDYSVERLRADDRARAAAELAELEHTELLDFGRLAELLGYDRKTNTLDFPVTPRGYRALSAVPRLPRLVAQKVVHHFGDLESLLAASDADLEAVEGVGEARAKEIREGIRRLQEVDIVDRYLMNQTAAASGRRYVRRRDIPELAVEEDERVEDLEDLAPARVRVRGRRQRRLSASRGGRGPEAGVAGHDGRVEGLPDDQDPAQRHDRDGPVRERPSWRGCAG